jgi:hypothetical protein
MSDLALTDDLEEFLNSLEDVPPVEMALDPEEFNALIDTWAQDVVLENGFANVPAPEAAVPESTELTDWLAGLEASALDMER